MMNDFDITAIENEVMDIIRSIGVSAKVYPNRPKAAEPASDFVVVMVSGSVQDRAALGECTVGVHLFAKDLNKVKNGKKLSFMYGRLLSGMPVESGRYIFDTEPTVLGDTPDDFGYHVRIIQFKTIIKIK